MRTVRVTIAGLMAIILLISVGLAALKNPTVVWASSLFTLMIALLSTALVATIATHGEPRITWAGFAIFGWVYVGIAFVAGSDANGVTPPPFLTHALKSYFEGNPSDPQVEVMNFPPYGESFLHEQRPARNLSSRAERVLDRREMRRILHTLGALAFALVGAGVGRFLAGRPRQPTESHR